MNEKNFQYLSDQVKYTGFGESLQPELKEKMEQGPKEFQLIHTSAVGSDTVVAALHFKKSEQSDLYFFNKYQLSLQKNNPAESLEQTFYINKANNITLKEAYNLMSGRAVNKDLTNKEGQVYNAWVQMDFKETDKNGNYLLRHYHQNYGFDLEKELAKHPLKELMHEQEKARLIESLHKGNRQVVTFLQEGQEHKMFIEAHPRFKSITVYDHNGQRLPTKQGQNKKHEEGERIRAKQTAKNESQEQRAMEDTGELPKASKKRSKKQSNSIG